MKATLWFCATAGQWRASQCDCVMQYGQWTAGEFYLPTGCDWVEVTTEIEDRTGVSAP